MEKFMFCEGRIVGRSNFEITNNVKITCLCFVLLKVWTVFHLKQTFILIYCKTIMSRCVSVSVCDYFKHYVHTFNFKLLTILQ